MQQLIRHGEQAMMQYVDEQNNAQTITVAQYVNDNLSQDKLSFSTPLFNDILQETLRHTGDAVFHAEHYFINHSNPTYSTLAAELVAEKYQLSKDHLHTDNVVGEEECLYDLMLHLTVNYKMSIMEEKLKEIMNKLRQPEISNDQQKVMEVMAQYKELLETKQKIAKILGD